MNRDPDFLNADFVDQIKWLMTKPAGNRSESVDNMIEARFADRPETATYSGVFWAWANDNGRASGPRKDEINIH
jgi:hypothetical protein